MRNVLDHTFFHAFGRAFQHLHLQPLHIHLQEIDRSANPFRQQ